VRTLVTSADAGRKHNIAARFSKALSRVRHDGTSGLEPQTKAAVESDTVAVAADRPALGARPGTRPSTAAAAAIALPGVGESSPDGPGAAPFSPVRRPRSESSNRPSRTRVGQRDTYHLLASIVGADDVREEVRWSALRLPDADG
jgi:hypothetical protein